MSGSESFGLWLKIKRRSRGLTQDQFARLVFCAEITLRKIEHDQLRPSHQLANVILDELDVPMNEREELIRLARDRQRPLYVQSLGSLSTLRPTRE
jgi:transcriptional regulator with XRE-family HTH domain